MAKLGLRLKIGNEEIDLDDIFLKISDYNDSSEYQDGEAVQLMQNTGIKYIDDTGVKRDLIQRYIGYDSDGYIADNYKADPNRIDASNLNAITDINGNNLVNLFYQLGTKKKVSEPLTEINNGDYYIRVTNNISNANYRFQFNFPIGTIIWMEIVNNNIYVKNNNKTTTYLTVTYDDYILSNSNISLNQPRFDDSNIYNTFLRNNDTNDYYLSQSNVNKHEIKCVII